ncbi:hypothetical protein B5G28_09975 [Faecalibacterium sp. An77]|nr:hypothetical protein B5G28_09975 [Faecalibacterium sp. An77]
MFQYLRRWCSWEEGVPGFEEKAQKTEPFSLTTEKVSFSFLLDQIFMNFLIRSTINIPLNWLVFVSSRFNITSFLTAIFVLVNVFFIF